MPESLYKDQLSPQTSVRFISVQSNTSPTTTETIFKRFEGNSPMASKMKDRKVCAPCALCVMRTDVFGAMRHFFDTFQRLFILSDLVRPISDFKSRCFIAIEKNCVVYNLHGAFPARDWRGKERNRKPSVAFYGDSIYVITLQSRAIDGHTSLHLPEVSVDRFNDIQDIQRLLEARVCGALCTATRRVARNISWSCR